MILFDYKQFIKDYVPLRLRNQLNLDWLNANNEPTITGYDASVARHNINVFDMKHTGQVMSLEHLLNEKVDVLGKKIIIGDTGNIPQWYAGQDNELPTKTIDFYSYEGSEISYEPNKPYIGQDSETPDLNHTLWVGSDVTVETDTTDFIVYVDALDYQDTVKLDIINYYVKKYKLGGFSYSVVPY